MITNTYFSFTTVTVHVAYYFRGRPMTADVHILSAELTNPESKKVALGITTLSSTYLEILQLRVHCRRRSASGGRHEVHLDNPDHIYIRGNSVSVYYFLNAVKPIVKCRCNDTHIRWLMLTVCVSR